MMKFLCLKAKGIIFIFKAGRGRLCSREFMVSAYLTSRLSSLSLKYIFLISYFEATEYNELLTLFLTMLKKRVTVAMFLFFIALLAHNVTFII